jgi:hypothetical protein
VVQRTCCRLPRLVHLAGKAMIRLNVHGEQLGAVLFNGSSKLFVIESRGFLGDQSKIFRTFHT